MFVFVRSLIAKGHALFEPMGEKARKKEKKKREKKGRKERRREGNGPALGKTQLPLPSCDSSSARPRACKSTSGFKPAAEIISKINHPSRSCSRHSPGIFLIVVAPRLSRGKRIARVKKNFRGRFTKNFIEIPMYLFIIVIIDDLERPVSKRGTIFSSKRVQYLFKK